jgi:hypothetical protein
VVGSSTKLNKLLLLITVTLTENEKKPTHIKWREIFAAICKVDILRIRRIIRHILFPNQTLDIFGVAFIIVITGVTLSPLVTTILSKVSNITPYHYLINDMIPNSLLQYRFTRILVHILDAAIFFFANAEGSRILSAMVFFIMVPSTIGLDSIRLLDKLISSKSRRGIYAKQWPDKLQLLHELYTRVEIMGRNISAQISTITFIAMVFGVCLNASLGFCALKMFSVLPILVHLVFALVECFTFFATGFLVSHAVKNYEKSKAAVERWRALPKQNTWIRMKLKVLRPYGVSVGIWGYTFYVLKKSIKSMYFCIILDVTIDLLLFLPDEMVAKWKSSN